METFKNVFQYPYGVISEVPFEMRGHWREQYFHNDNPIVLELGCGKGEYTVGLARVYPNINFIGVDIKGARIYTGANRALDWFQSTRQTENASNDRFIFVKSEYKLVKIMFDDILYIEGLKDYVKIYLANDHKPIMSLMNMKKIEESLPKPEFMRIHRSYIVHMKKIDGIDRFRVVIGDSILPISDSYKTTLQDYLDGHTL